jgi:hypothetical protein
VIPVAAPIVIPRPDPLTRNVPIWGVLWGAFGAVTSFLAPESVSTAIPKWGVLGFFLGLLLTSAATLITMRPKHGAGVRWNIRAWAALGSVCATYAGWAVQAFGFVRPFVVVSLLLVICVSSFEQARRLNAALSRSEE